MKLTKKQLKRIIKEELGNALSEEERSPGNIQAMRDRAIEIINKMSTKDLVQLLQQINPET